MRHSTVSTVHDQLGTSPTACRMPIRGTRRGSPVDRRHRSVDLPREHDRSRLVSPAGCCRHHMRKCGREGQPSRVRRDRDRGRTVRPGRGHRRRAYQPPPKRPLEGAPLCSGTRHCPSQRSSRGVGIGSSSGRAPMAGCRLPQTFMRRPNDAELGSPPCRRRMPAAYSPT